MMRWLMPLFVAGVLVGAGPLVQPAGASAADVMQIAGTGVILPGLTLVPEAQAINFGGNAVITGTQLGYVACNLNGNGLDDSYAEGEGILGGACGSIVLPLCIYDRVGVALSLMCVNAGVQKSVAYGQFLFTPLQLPPSAVVGYDLQGAALYVDVT